MTRGGEIPGPFLSQCAAHKCFSLGQVRNGAVGWIERVVGMTHCLTEEGYHEVAGTVLDSPRQVGWIERVVGMTHCRPHRRGFETAGPVLDSPGQIRNGAMGRIKCMAGDIVRPLVPSWTARGKFEMAGMNQARGGDDLR